PQVGGSRTIALHTDYRVHQKKVGDPQPEHLDDHLMEAFGVARRLVKLGLLGAGQKTVTVFDGPRHDRQAMGFEFRQTDDDIGITDNPGQAHRGHEVRMEVNLEGMVADVLVITLGCFHQSGLLKAFLVGSIIKQTRIVADDNGGGPHGFHLFHHGAQHRRMGDDALTGFRDPQHIGLDQHPFPTDFQGEKFKSAVDGLTDILIVSRMDHDFRHSLPFIAPILKYLVIITCLSWHSMARKLLRILMAYPPQALKSRYDLNIHAAATPKSI